MKRGKRGENKVCESESEEALAAGAERKGTKTKAAINVNKPGRGK
jgi:hypothetical protein